jgi:hypothetical protein
MLKLQSKASDRTADSGRVRTVPDIKSGKQGWQFRTGTLPTTPLRIRDWLSDTHRMAELPGRLLHVDADVVGHDWLSRRGGTQGSRTAQSDLVS